MNVNPFSYLINKISQKVSKSGDTMTGTLEINAPSASDFNLGKANTSTGRFFIFASQDSYRARLQRGTLTADRNFTFPDASGTLALTSDVTYVDKNFSLTLSANDGNTVDVTPTIPSGYTIIGISPIFGTATHWVFANVFNSGSSYTLCCRNFSSGSMAIVGHVRYAIAKN